MQPSRRARTTEEEAEVAGACENRTHRSRRRRLHRGFEDRHDHQARSTPLKRRTQVLSGQGSDGLDLDPGTARKRGDRDGGAGRPMVAEGPGVDLVHGGEVGHVHEEHGGLHHLRQVAPADSRMARIFWSTRSVCSAIPPSTSSPLAGSKPTWPAVKRKPVGPDALAVGPDGRGRSWGRDCGDRHQNNPSMVPSAMDPDGLGGRGLGQPGHGHDVAGQRHHEAGTRRRVDVPDGEPEAGRAGPAWSDRH